VSLKKNVVKIHFIFFNVNGKDKKNPDDCRDLGMIKSK
jgi:hypothetical protein